MENQAPQKPGRSLKIPALGILYLISGLVIAFYAVTGWNYYTTPVRERPRRADFMNLKPGGTTGHGLGMIGGFFILSTLAYSARKRWKPLKKTGTIPRWLEVHVFFGTVGPLLIILHTGLKLNGLVAVAFWAMIAVVLSGFVGRFLMRQIPRDIKGHMTDVQELVKTRETLRQKLMENAQISASTIEAIERTSLGAGSGAREPLIYMAALTVNTAVSRIRIARLMKHAAEAVDPHGPNKSALNRIAFEEAMLNRRILLLKKSQEFFRNWHRIHRPFTWVMFVIVLIHVVVSVYLGYRWIF
jgi:hypothetical protein